MRKKKAPTRALGLVYLIHLEPGLCHARHYVGWTTNLKARIDAHRNGTGSPLLYAATLAGVKWWVACVWPADRSFERLVKNRHGSAPFCPVCTESPALATEQRYCPEPPLGFFPAHPTCDYHVSYAFDL